ncbi:hypothetical protein FE782_11680 [Paenibacillus antri]|uniref:Secreted protein n=1 Tax=Paenibacillus antri TaxID=2582848 RepID=A0A5R9G8I4_9BACL|nr:hypothetical protein [Paenibacillus antri]TLS52031.1 hypothetical protein FE782_11680 [Paenibacillus antri]
MQRMVFKMLCVLLLTAMLTRFGQPGELEHAVERLAWLKAVEAPSSTDQAESASERNRRENAIGKGVLERSFRLRSRLNTHLLMLKFKR